MEQITAMKIKGVTFTDFRNHKAPQSYTFGDSFAVRLLFTKYL